MADQPSSDALPTINPFGAVQALPTELSDAAQVSQAREMHELQTLFVVAQRRGRDMARAYDTAMQACQRPEMADKALYKYPRGGAEITGPSVTLARELAIHWTGLRVESPRIVELTEDVIHIRAVAFDLVNFTSQAMEDRFARLVQRKVGKGPNAKTEWVKPDERDLRELINRRAAILERNVLLKLIPRDVVQSAIQQCHDTMLNTASKMLVSDKAGALAKLTRAFEAVRVSREMLEEWLENSLDRITAAQYAELIGIGQSIRDGQSRVEDHFSIPDQPVQSEAAQAMRDRLQKRQPTASTPPSAPVAPTASMDKPKAQTAEQEEAPIATPTADLFAGDQPDPPTSDYTVELEGVSLGGVRSVIVDLERRLSLRPAKHLPLRREQLETEDLEQADLPKLTAYYCHLRQANDLRNGK